MEMESMGRRTDLMFNVEYIRTRAFTNLCTSNYSRVLIVVENGYIVLLQIKGEFYMVLKKEDSLFGEIHNISVVEAHNIIQTWIKDGKNGKTKSSSN